ncbi:MAG: hypothetical protein A3H32_19945 [Betaproteobacteria bacterium RIFCSPLOWO2_02_FULL_63_19]|nr:MAG: hypothetical protein A3H32_19945 [Betaproteobacteria bacterium RIFCSPLOWO2_02_FULL_63_19]
MNFELNDEQRMLTDSARRFFEREFPLKRLREFEVRGWDAFLPVYQQMGELGWLGIGVPEDAGGAGGSWLDLELFAEEAGRALVPTLQITSIALAGQALVAMGTSAQRQHRLAELLAGRRVIAPALLNDSHASREPTSGLRATASDGRVVLDGKLRHVDAFAIAAELLVAARADDGSVTLHLLDRSADGISASETTLTSLERRHDVELRGVACSADATLPGDWGAWLRIADGAKIIAAGWAVGATRAALERAVAYAKERYQFDRPIGSFQAVQHRLADAAILTEQATAITRFAAWQHGEHGHHDREAAMAKLVAGRAMRLVSNAAVLTHGGYGFMEEFDIQLYVRRAKQYEYLIEDPTLQRELIAAQDCEDGIRI